MDDKLQFKHEFTDRSADGMLSFDTDTSDDQRIRVDTEDGGNIWISANRAGWLHLARICAELGLADFEPGYHVHKTLEFTNSDGSSPEISLEVEE